MIKIAIIGFGRFGELLANLCRQTFEVSIVESDPLKADLALSQGYPIKSLDYVTQCDFIFLAVPISLIEPLVISIAPLLSEQQVVIDLCSVKVYPTRLMQKYLVDSQILGCHPLFGPDSAKKGLKGQQVALCPINITPTNLQIIKDFWLSHELEVIETTPDKHDQDSAYSQAFTYSIAKIILNMELPEITFKTRSFKALSEVARLSANDTAQLFHDMLLYNPYFPKMKIELEAAINKTDNQLTDLVNESERLKLTD